MQEVPEQLLWCDQCRMHTQASRLFKHQQSEKYHKLTERRLRRRDVEIAAMCGEMEFNLDGEEGYERVENVPTFQPIYGTTPRPNG